MERYAGYSSIKHTPIHLAYTKPKQSGMVSFSCCLVKTQANEFALLVLRSWQRCRVTEKAINAIWNPSDWEILAEHEQLEAKQGGLLSGGPSHQLELQSLSGESGAVAGNGMDEDVEPGRGHCSQNSSDQRWLKE